MSDYSDYIPENRGCGCNGRGTDLSPYEPSRIPTPTAPVGKCHAYFDEFSTFWPMYACKPDQVCAALAMAETYVQGLIEPQQKKLAHMNMAAHLLDQGFIQVTENSGRAAAASKGDMPSRTMTPVDGGPPAWLGSTMWGLQAWMLINGNPRLGVLTIV